MKRGSNRGKNENRSRLSKARKHAARGFIDPERVLAQTDNSVKPHVRSIGGLLTGRSLISLNADMEEFTTVLRESERPRFCGMLLTTPTDARLASGNKDRYEVEEELKELLSSGSFRSPITCMLGNIGIKGPTHEGNAPRYVGMYVNLDGEEKERTQAERNKIINVYGATEMLHMRAQLVTFAETNTQERAADLKTYLFIATSSFRPVTATFGRAEII